MTMLAQAFMACNLIKKGIPWKVSHNYVERRLHTYGAPYLVLSTVWSSILQLHTQEASNTSSLARMLVEKAHVCMKDLRAQH